MIGLRPVRTLHLLSTVATTTGHATVVYNNYQDFSLRSHKSNQAMIHHAITGDVSPLNCNVTAAIAFLVRLM
jgi:hypothetical protein